MSILKTKSKGRVEYKRVGAPLPLPVYSYLAAYALAHGKTKTGVIIALLKELENKVDERKLLNKLIERYKTAWEANKEVYAGDLGEFKTEIFQELDNRGISVEMINKILAKIS